MDNSFSKSMYLEAMTLLPIEGKSHFMAALKHATERRSSSAGHSPSQPMSDDGSYSPPEMSPQNYECEICGSAYGTELEMHQHFYDAHCARIENEPTNGAYEDIQPMSFGCVENGHAASIPSSVPASDEMLIPTDHCPFASDNAKSPPALNVQKKPRPFKCQYRWCGRTCKTEAQFSLHQRKFHSFKCEICDRGCKSEEDKQRHYFQSHFPPACSRCQIACLQNGHHGNH